MKPKILSEIGVVLAALLVVGAICVPAVSADENSQGDPVSRSVELERSPFLFDDRGDRLSDREISRMIETMPRVTYLDGMNESRSKELSEMLNQLHKYRSVKVGDGSETSPQPAPVPTENIVELLKVNLNKQEPVSLTLGGLPFSKGGRSASYPDLENFTDAMGDLIRDHYLYPHGSLIGFGYDIDGYLRVGIWNGPPPPENVCSIETVYAMLDERAKEMGIESIPVKFTVFTSPPELVLGPQIEPQNGKSILYNGGVTTAGNYPLLSEGACNEAFEDLPEPIQKRQLPPPIGGGLQRGPLAGHRVAI
ncbi:MULTISPECIES: hypothetical protein [unclassified Methanoculleus]|jgi:hypothetical protein|uniref:Uncharacterized protein n=1 Tax=Methanoculleus palmolei TaxID=72612 RepID=A0ABD8AAA5_9EURY|nr:hypothetical protein [Methanoculleus sp. UBA377]WOX55967.1 hypothetical protein R6Y95_01195 [Methanoculleus palmolei]